MPSSRRPGANRRSAGKPRVTIRPGGLSRCRNTRRRGTEEAHAAPASVPARPCVPLWRGRRKSAAGSFSGTAAGGKGGFGACLPRVPAFPLSSSGCSCSAVRAGRRCPASRHSRYPGAVCIFFSSASSNGFRTSCCAARTARRAFCDMRRRGGGWLSLIGGPGICLRCGSSPTWQGEETWNRLRGERTRGGESCRDVRPAGCRPAGGKATRIIFLYHDAQEARHPRGGVL